MAESAARFSGESVADPATLRALFDGGGGFRFGSGPLYEVLAEAGLVASRGEARRLIQGGGVTVNGVRVIDPLAIPEPIDGEWLDVRLGKRRRVIGRRAG